MNLTGDFIVDGSDPDLDVAAVQQEMQARRERGEAVLATIRLPLGAAPEGPRRLPGNRRDRRAMLRLMEKALRKSGKK